MLQHHSSVPAGMVDCHTHGLEPLGIFCYELRDEYRTRQRWLNAQTRLTLQARAFCRSMVGEYWHHGGIDTSAFTDKQLTELNKAADVLYKAAIQTLKGKGVAALDDALDDELADGEEGLASGDILTVPAPTPIRAKKLPALPMVAMAPRAAEKIAPLLVARQAIHAPLLKQARIVEHLADCLPIAPWARAIRGFSVGQLGAIVAEATGDHGSVDCYRGPNALQKRMGVGVVQGQRQRRTTDKELAIAMGYDAERCALMTTIADTLIKGNFEPFAPGTAKEDKVDGRYRQIYAAEKQRQALLHPDLTPRHRDLRAKRYMVKQLLKQLWREWTGRGVEWEGS